MGIWGGGGGDDGGGDGVGDVDGLETWDQDAVMSQSGMEMKTGMRTGGQDGDSDRDKNGRVGGDGDGG